jgi:hypothetical protein
MFLWIADVLQATVVGLNALEVHAAVLIVHSDVDMLNAHTTHLAAPR